MTSMLESPVDDKAVRALSSMIRPTLAQNVWRVNVLLVEDDAADTRLITKALKAHRDVGEVITRNLPGRALLELAAGRMRPTVIFLDLKMPRIDGFKFLEVLRKIPAMAKVPVVIVTSSAFARDVHKASRASVSGYLVKPEDYDELEARIEGIINQVIGFRRS